MYLEGEYLTQNPTWHAEDSPAKARWIETLLARNNCNPRTIAEIGCGAGEILRELQARRPDATYVGFDISPQAFQICSPKANEGLSFRLEDLTAVDERFDALLVIDIFEHVPDYMGFIESLKDKAEYKIFHIPLDLSVQALLRGKVYMDIRKKLGHLHYFFKDTALATLDEAGYEVIDWFYTAGSLELPNPSFKKRLLNGPRRLLQAVDKDLAARLFGGYSIMVLTR